METHNVVDSRPDTAYTGFALKRKERNQKEVKGK